MFFFNAFLAIMSAFSFGKAHCELVFVKNKSSDLPILQNTIIYNLTKKNILQVYDIKKEKEYLYAELNERGELYFTMHLVDWSQRQRAGLYGPRLYREMIEYFSLDKIEKIIGVWVDGTNLLAYQKARGQGLNQVEAAFSTWSGRQAAQYGFRRIAHIDELTNLFTGVETVRVEFTR